MATYDVTSVRLPFRVGYLLREEARRRKMPVNRMLVEILMFRYADKLNKHWSPADERKLRDQFSQGGKK